MKIRAVGADPFRSEGHTDRLTDVTKLIVAFFPNPAKAPIKSMKIDKWKRIAWSSGGSFIPATFHAAVVLI